MIINFGKYKGYSLDNIYEFDKSYIRWLYEKCDDVDLRFNAGFVMGLYSNNKIENIIKECLMYRGYSEAEALMFIKQIKNI